MSDRLIPGWLVGVVALVVAALIGLNVAGPAIRELIDEVAEVADLAPGRTAPPTDAAAVPSRSIAPDELGRIRFGTAPGPDRCSVANPIDAPIEAFPAGRPIHVTAILRNPVAATEELVLLYTARGGEFESVQEAQDPAQPSCWSNRTPIGPLEPGIYAFTILGDVESQAEGVLQVE